MSTAESLSTPELEVRESAGFWFVRLDRPTKRNALSDELVAGLARAWDAIAAREDARAMVIFGAGGNFCAGADFDGFLALLARPAGEGEDPIAQYNRQFGRMLEGLVALPVPTLAVARGAAMGGGCGLAAACDRVIASEDASFAFTEVTLGVAPAQILPFVVRRVGATRARWLMLTGRRLQADEALAEGIVDELAPATGLPETLRRALASLAAAEPAATHTTKRLIGLSLEQPLGATLDQAAQEFAGLLRRGAVREGIAAVRERRPPAWRVDIPELPSLD